MAKKKESNNVYTGIIIVLGILVVILSIMNFTSDNCEEKVVPVVVGPEGEILYVDTEGELEVVDEEGNVAGAAMSFALPQAKNTLQLGYQIALPQALQAQIYQAYQAANTGND